MTEHTVGTREQWQAARKELLERENELANLSKELAQRRRELPWVPVEKEYMPKGRGDEFRVRRHDEYEHTDPRR